MAIEPRGPTDDATLDAGEFGAWVAEIRAALDGTGEADVPCGTCTACCTSSQFVHIGPEETDALAHIPAELLFPAPRLPRGHVLMGYDEHGRCPMLVDNRCRIYAHRPRTCRTYDCRIFPAAGLQPDEADKALIAERTRRWVFSHRTAADQARHDAVRAAADHFGQHPESLPERERPHTPTQLAVVAVRHHENFIVGEAQPAAD